MTWKEIARNLSVQQCCIWHSAQWNSYGHGRKKNCDFVLWLWLQENLFQKSVTKCCAHWSAVSLIDFPRKVILANTLTEIVFEKRPWISACCISGSSGTRTTIKRRERLCSEAVIKRQEIKCLHQWDYWNKLQIIVKKGQTDVSLLCLADYYCLNNFT